MLFGVCVGETLSPRGFLKLEPEEVAKGGEASVRGVVTFVSGIERRFVIAPQDNPRHAGVMVLCGDGVSSPENGDLVLVSGQTIRYGELAALVGYIPGVSIKTDTTTKRLNLEVTK